MFVAVAMLPVYPAASIALFFVLGVREFARRKSIPAATPVMIAVLLLGVLGVVANGFAFMSDTVHSPLENSDMPIPVDVTRGGNLLANTDLSGLQPWSAAEGFGPYAAYAAAGLWQVVREGSVPVTEIRTNQEVPIRAGTAYEASVLVRPDTEVFSGHLVFRTRGGWEEADYSLESVEDGWIRLSGVLPQADSPRRLRALHIADIDGDWNVLELGFAMLQPVAAKTAEAFTPAFPLYPPQYGVVWWLGVILLLVAVWLPFAYEVGSDAASLVANGLLAGLLLQLAITLAQAFLLPEVGRQSGTLGHPNILGHSATVAAFASLALSQRSLKRILFTLGIVGGIVFLSGSDAAAVMLTAGSFMMLVVLVAERKRRFLIPVLGAAGLLVISFGLAQVWQSLLSDTNNLARLQALRGSWELIRQYPLTGVGHSNFAHFYEFIDPGKAGPLYRVSHAHSFLALAVENGLPAFAAAVAVVTIASWQALQRKHNHVLVALLVYAGLNLFDYTAFNSAVLLPVWVACSIAAKRKAEVHGAEVVRL